MTKEANIKLERTQSLLKDILPIALASLSDTRLNALSVVGVKCSKGKYFAEVFLDAPLATPKEKQAILHQLKKARGILKDFCLKETGWFRCPDFEFHFDTTLQQETSLDKIFLRIANERKNREEDSQ